MSLGREVDLCPGEIVWGVCRVLLFWFVLSVALVSCSSRVRPFAVGPRVAKMLHTDCY